VTDASYFADVLPIIRQRLVDLERDLETMTLIYDKGNVSRENQKRVDSSQLHYVTSLTAASQHDFVEKANARLAPVDLGRGDTVPAYRERRKIWGAERTAVMLLSQRLREGQMRGILQHVESALRWLSELADTLSRGKQRRDRARIQRDIESRLQGRQHLREVLRFELTGNDPKLSLAYEFDRQAFDTLADERLGRVVLITDRHDWSTAEIIRAYRGQSQIEAVFAHLKDPMHLGLRPQYHWTDQKLHVHVFICILAYLLARTLFLRAERLHVPYASLESLLDALTQVRRVTVARSATGKGRMRISTQLEQVDQALVDLLPALGVPK
jgi:transposase